MRHDASLEMITLLLNLGGCAKASDSNNTTLLHLAITGNAKPITNAPEKIALLIKNGADVNARNYLQETPLHKVPEFGNSSNISSEHNEAPIITQLLVNNKAHVNVQDRIGNTPLHYAVFSNALKTAEILIHNDARLHRKNGSNLSPFEIASDEDWNRKDMYQLMYNHMKKLYGE